MENYEKLLKGLKENALDPIEVSEEQKQASQTDTEIICAENTENTLSVPAVKEKDLEEKLNTESLEILNEIVNEANVDRQKDLTSLFNINQNKKTMLRATKLNELLDKVTEQTLLRFTARPDEISNKELLDSLKIVNDIIERGQKQYGTEEEAPLIQINQQNNDISIESDQTNELSRASRERVKNAVMSLLGSVEQEDDSNINIVEDEN